MDEPVLVVGVHGGRPAVPLPPTAGLVAGAERHLAAVDVPSGAEVLPLGPVGRLVDRLRAPTPGRAVVLASGDPGFFGIVRTLVAAGVEVEVHPAPSSVSVAFARAGLGWDDAAVVSAHGRPLAAAASAAAAAAKAAVLTEPAAPPEALGRALLEAGAGPRDVWVCSRLGEPDEAVTRTDLAGLAAGCFDPLSIVVLAAAPTTVAPGAGLAWGGPGLPDEVRAVALHRLAAGPGDVVWDAGAGLRAEGVVPVDGPLEGLPDPDRVLSVDRPDVLAAGWLRLRPGGSAVAVSTELEPALDALSRLGSMVQVSVGRAARLPGGGVRLAGEAPVFVAWGAR